MLSIWVCRCVLDCLCLCFICATMSGIPGFPSRVYFLSQGYPCCLPGLSGLLSTHSFPLFIYKSPSFFALFVSDYYPVLVLSLQQQFAWFLTHLLPCDKMPEAQSQFVLCLLCYPSISKYYRQVYKKCGFNVSICMHTTAKLWHSRRVSFNVHRHLWFINFLTLCKSKACCGLMGATYNMEKKKHNA